MDDQTITHMRAYAVLMPTQEQTEQINERVIETIRKIRERNGACTARSVASELRLSPNIVRFRCEALRQDGRVNWTPMPGSLHVVEPIEDQLFDIKLLELAKKNKTMMAKATKELLAEPF